MAYSITTTEPRIAASLSTSGAQLGRHSLISYTAVYTFHLQL